MTTVTTKSIDPDFLSVSDAEYISEIIRDWLSENEIPAEGFSYKIEVTWEDQ